MTRLALTAARLIDGINPAVDGATVVIDGDRIVEVSSGPPPHDADTVIDLAGRTVMPGMFTCHFHSTYHELGSKPNTPYGDEYPPSYLALDRGEEPQGGSRLWVHWGGRRRGLARRRGGRASGHQRWADRRDHVSGPPPGSCRRRGTATTACRGIGACRLRGRYTSVTVPTDSVSASGRRSSGAPR